MPDLLVPLTVAIPKVVASIYPEQVDSHSLWLELPEEFSAAGEIPLVYQTGCIQN